MIDSIVMYPLDVMPLELGLNVLGLSSPELLFKFVEGLQGFGDDVVLGDGSKTAVLTKSILYVGDCADIVDYNALFQKAAIKKIIDEFDVRSGEGAESIARSLSGGNQQKAIIGREIELNPELLIAAQPTRGLDVGSIEYIHKRLVEQRDRGKAVLLVSLELDEILNVSDRIAIINNGELIGIVNADETNENEVGLMMAGIRGGEKHEV